MEAKKRKTLSLWRNNVNALNAQEEKKYKQIDIETWKSILQINERISRVMDAGVDEKNLTYFEPMVRILSDLIKGVYGDDK